MLSLLQSTKLAELANCYPSFVSAVFWLHWRLLMNFFLEPLLLFWKLWILMLMLESSVLLCTLLSPPHLSVIIHPHPSSALSRPVSGRSAATRWRSSWQTARGASLCPGRRCRGWTPRASVKWRTWPTSPASTRPRCCTTWGRDTTPAWSMWGLQST